MPSAIQITFAPTDSNNCFEAKREFPVVVTSSTTITTLSLYASLSPHTSIELRWVCMDLSPPVANFEIVCVLLRHL